MVGTSFWTRSMVLKDAILVTGKGDARCKGETSRGKDKEEWVVRDEGYGASRLVVQHHWSSNQVTLLMIFWTFLTPFILIWHLTHYDSHSLEAVSHSSSSQVIGSSHRSIFILIFPLCFILLLIFFLIYHLIHHAVLKWNFLEYSSDSLMSNCLQISEMLLSHSWSSCI